MNGSPNLYKIVDSEAGKTVGFYGSDEAARAAGIRLCREHVSLRDSLVLVTMDEAGMPLKFENLKGKSREGGAAHRCRTCRRQDGDRHPPS